jgi:hypothetical protein
MHSLAGRLCPLAIALLCAGCSNGEVGSPAGAEAHFAIDGAIPSFLQVPFPTDAYVEADGTLVDTIPGLDHYIVQNAPSLQSAFGRMRGFGLHTGGFFRIDRTGPMEPGEPEAATVDAQSLPATPEASIEASSSVFLVDLDAASAEPAVLPCRAGVQDDRAQGSASWPVVAVLPARGIVLREARRYAAVITTSVTAGGLCVQPSAEFVAIRDGLRRSSAVESLYGNAVDEVVEKVPALSDRSRIAALTVFTTQAASGELFDLRARVGAMPPPVLSWDPADLAPMHAGLFAASPLPGYTAALDEWLGSPAKLPGGMDDPAADQTSGAGHDAIAVIGTAVFNAPNFLQDRPEGYTNPEHAVFARDAGGQPIQAPEKPFSTIWVTFALPKGPVPPAGFPVVIIQHGLQSDRSFLLAMANTFALQGFASVAIEAATFGTRSPDPSYVADALSRFPWSGSAGYGGPDGFVDSQASALALFGNFVNFGASRDQLRQSALDMGTLAEMLNDPNLSLGPLLSAVPGAKLDGKKLAYVGDSFGSVLGALVAAIEPRIGAMVLNVGGGGVLTEIVANAPGLGTILGTAGGLSFGIPRDRLGGNHPLVHMLQAILDPADPLSYAGAIVNDPVAVPSAAGGKKSVLLIEVIWDELVSNEGTEALAYAAGMPLASPHVGPNGGVVLSIAEPVGGEIRGVPVAGATAVVVQASPATHGSNLYSAKGLRHYAIPFAQEGATPFPSLPQDIAVSQPYLELQSMMVGFFASSFAGEVPVVKGFPVPVRDFDADGAADP